MFGLFNCQFARLLSCQQSRQQDSEQIQQLLAAEFVGIFGHQL
jgi:hypothetical protein